MNLRHIFVAIRVINFVPPFVHRHLIHNINLFPSCSVHFCHWFLHPPVPIGLYDFFSSNAPRHACHMAVAVFRKADILALQKKYIGITSLQLKHFQWIFVQRIPDSSTRPRGAATTPQLRHVFWPSGISCQSIWQCDVRSQEHSSTYDHLRGDDFSNPSRVHMCQGRSTPYIGDFHPTFNGESL